MMASVSWYTPDKLLHIKFAGALTVRELEKINQDVIETFNLVKNKISVLMDIDDLECSYQSADQLRSTQLYMNHDQIETAFVVSASKLNYLIFLMAFNTSRVPINKHTNFAEVETHLKQQGFITR